MIFDEFSEKNAYISSILSNNADTKFFNFLKDITVKSKKTEKKVLKKIKILYKIEEFLRNLSFSNKNKIFWIFRRKKNRSQEKQPKYLRGIFLWVLKRKIKHSEKIPKLLNQASFKENNNEWVLDSEKNGNFQNNFSQRQKKDKLSSCFSSDLNFSRKIIYHNLNELILKRQEKEIYFFKKLNKIQRLNWPCFFKIFEYPYIFFRRKKKQILTQSTEKFLARFLVCLLYISFESNFLPFNCLLNNNIKILIH
ncbi:hypothetical protein T484DRAFT_1989703 [Baffinella frigidus]|nr:hypothetical protein T484DRAFT_1989703 [Cryptophyta sp. CCMP2293]